MANSGKWALSLAKFGGAAIKLAALCGAATALPQAVVAQVAGGSEAGGGAPQIASGALLATSAAPEPPRCIHRSIDPRRSNDIDNDRLTVWLSVSQPGIAMIKASGSTVGQDSGTFAITVLRDGIPVATSPEIRGAGPIDANVGGTVKLVPGRQYKITAKATMTNKQLQLFDMYVGVGKTCP